MTTVPDIIAHVEGLTGHPLHRDEGVHHGTADRPVRAATVSWMATPGAIHAAGTAGSELLIVHESLYFPYDVVISHDPPPGWQEWRVNRQRRELLERHDLTCLRIHGSADEICILDTFAALLGLGEPVHIDGFVKVYEIPPLSLGALMQRVKKALGMTHLRLGAPWDAERLVHRVGLPWGGLGLFVNVAYQQQLVAQGCDVFIAGETDNYGFRFAAECDIPMIETSHELSENPGLRRFTEMLSSAFPGVTFRFHEDECIWHVE